MKNERQSFSLTVIFSLTDALKVYFPLAFRIIIVVSGGDNMKNIFIYDESESIRGRLPEIIFSGNSAVTVDCVKEILEYTSEKVRLSLGRLTICFCGDCLSICSLGSERITLTGSILSVSFSS